MSVRYYCPVPRFWVLSSAGPKGQRHKESLFRSDLRDCADIIRLYKNTPGKVPSVLDGAQTGFTATLLHKLSVLSDTPPPLRKVLLEGRCPQAGTTTFHSSVSSAASVNPCGGEPPLSAMILWKTLSFHLRCIIPPDLLSISTTFSPVSAQESLSRHLENSFLFCQTA